MHAGAAETPGDGRGLHEGYAIFVRRSTGERKAGPTADGRETKSERSRRWAQGAVDAIVPTTRSMLRSYGIHI
jgi:hypothetical protein